MLFTSPNSYVHGSAEIAGLDIVGLDTDGRMCGQLTELKLQNFIP